MAIMASCVCVCVCVCVLLLERWASVWHLINHCFVCGLDGIPSDGTPIVVLNTFYMPIYIIYYIFVVLGIIFALVCLLFNIIFRNRKWVIWLVEWTLWLFVNLTVICLFHTGLFVSSVLTWTTSSFWVLCWSISQSCSLSFPPPTL